VKIYIYIFSIKALKIGGVLPFLSSVKFLSPTKDYNISLTGCVGAVYSWLSKYSCSFGILTW
jgi:hypothetical protein